MWRTWSPVSVSLWLMVMGAGAATLFFFFAQPPGHSDPAMSIASTLQDSLTKRDHSAYALMGRIHSELYRAVENRAWGLLGLTCLYALSCVVCGLLMLSSWAKNKVNRNLPNSNDGLFLELLIMNSISLAITFIRFCLTFFKGLVRLSDYFGTLNNDFICIMFIKWTAGNIAFAVYGDYNLKRGKWHKVQFFLKAIALNAVVFLISTISVGASYLVNSSETKGYDDEIESVIYFSRIWPIINCILEMAQVLLNIFGLRNYGLQLGREHKRMVGSGLLSVLIIWIIFAGVVYFSYLGSTLGLMKHRHDWKCSPNIGSVSMVFPMIGPIFLSAVLCENQRGNEVYASVRFQVLNGLCEIIPWSLTPITLIVFLFGIKLLPGSTAAADGGDAAGGGDGADGGQAPQEMDDQNDSDKSDESLEPPPTAQLGIINRIPPNVGAVLNPYRTGAADDPGESVDQNAASTALSDSTLASRTTIKTSGGGMRVRRKAKGKGSQTSSKKLRRGRPA